MSTSTKSYVVTVEIDVHLRDGALVAQNAESVAAAVRQHLRIILPPGWRKQGYMFQTTTMNVEAKEKSASPLSSPHG